MMKFCQISCLFAAALMLGSPSAYAKGDAARLMLKAEGASQVLEIIRTSDGAAVTKGGNISVDLPVKADKWTEVSVTFKSSVDTPVLLRLSATWTKEDSVWVYLDNVKVDGVPLLNPDLEEGTPGKTPADWKFLKTGANQGEYLQDSSGANTGKGYVKVPYSCPLTQTIQIPQGKEVTVSFWAKLAPAK